jgi:magnesium transporter
VEKEILKEPNYVEELLEIIRGDISDEEKKDKLSDYHENDIADALEELTPEERQKIYRILGPDRVAEIFAYLENVDVYLDELKLEHAADLVSRMDSDDAVDVLEEVDDETRDKLVEMMDDESSRDVKLIQSYDDDEVGSVMTTNFIVIQKGLTIRQAMRELVKQAGENDNISTIYVVDENERFYGAIDLKDLIVAREYADLEDLISTSYPYVNDHELISDCIDRIRDYSEDSIPVLDEDEHILGVLTAQDLVEVVDDEMGDDYAKLAGLTEEEDLNEPTTQSMKKRLPWLIILLFLGLIVSVVIGRFEAIVIAVPIIISFQSIVLGMSGNVGTQSLAVTIRVLMDENLETRQKVHMVLKEMKVGFCDGLILGSIAFAVVGVYIVLSNGYPVPNAFLISMCVGGALVAAMTISSLMGTLIPMFLHKINIDPAVASGPLISTMSDLVGVLAYYGLAWFLLINVLHM